MHVMSDYSIKRNLLTCQDQLLLKVAHMIVVRVVRNPTANVIIDHRNLCV
jgi:hypothetical protein